MQYIVAKFCISSYYTFGDMNYFLLFAVQYRQTESDAYEPTVQLAQVGSKRCLIIRNILKCHIYIENKNARGVLGRMEKIGLQIFYNFDYRKQETTVGFRNTQFSLIPCIKIEEIVAIDRYQLGNKSAGKKSPKIQCNKKASVNKLCFLSA